jgi:hypothetical protein
VPQSFSNYWRQQAFPAGSGAYACATKQMIR